MNSIYSFVENISNDPKIRSNLTPELKEKIQAISTLQNDREKVKVLLEVLEFADSLSIYLPDIFNILFEKLDILFNVEPYLFKIVLDSILFWQDWKIGLKLLDKITFSTQLSSAQWLLLADFNFKLGFLCYNLFKGSNYALTLLFFEKTLNYLSKSENDRKIFLILSATLWYIGQIEFEKGYSIKGSDYQLSSVYYQKNFTLDEFEEYFKTSRSQIRNSLILSSFQAATDFFIASKVSAQSFQYEFGKNYLYHSYSYLKRILKIIDSKTDYSILEQIRTFLLQLHTIIDKERFIQNHSCDSNILSTNELNVGEFIQYIDKHSSLLEDRDKKLLWLAVLDQGGIVIFEYDFEENNISSKNSLYSSFIHVVSKWGQVELESGPAKELNFMGNSFIIENEENIEVIAVVSKPSADFHFSVKNFALNFNKSFGYTLKTDWNGNTKIFESKGLEYIDLLKKNLLQ